MMMQKNTNQSDSIGLPNLHEKCRIVKREMQLPHNQERMKEEIFRWLNLNQCVKKLQAMKRNHARYKHFMGDAVMEQPVGS